MRNILMIAETNLWVSVALAGASQTVTLDVKNMYCDLCPVTVRKSLEHMPGVAEAKVDFAQKTATVSLTVLSNGSPPPATQTPAIIARQTPPWMARARAGVCRLLLQ